MKVPFIDLNRQYKQIKNEVKNIVNDIFETSSFAQGKYVAKFEKEFAIYNNAKYCVCVSNGTAALHASLVAAGVGIGDEVILPVNTFIATAEAVSHCGATPVFVDISEDDYNIDVNKIAKAITPQTKVILPVHLYGQMANMDKIIQIAYDFGIKIIIEDSSQAHGIQSKSLTDFSNCSMSSFSFYPSKNLGTCGEGGAVLTNDDHLSLKLRYLRNHGSVKKYNHDMVGYNYKMSEIQAAVLSVKLKYLDEWNADRRRIANRYKGKLNNIKGIVMPMQTGLYHVYHLFVVRVKNRDYILNELTNSGIGCGIHYPVPLHLTGAYQNFAGYFPIAEKVCDEILSLPMFPGLTNEEIDHVCDILSALIRE